MSDPLTIVARIEAYPDHTERVKIELLKLIAPTLAETGCLQYDLHQDNDNPSVFLFFERWENRELWRAHMENTHVAQFSGATAGAIASFSLNEMSRVTG